MKNTSLILCLLFSIFTPAADEDWTVENIPMQDLSYSYTGGLVNTGNSNYRFYSSKVDFYNAKFGRSNPIGYLKYDQLSKQYNMQPSQVCMQLETSCQAKLAKVSDCSPDKGDGVITCNNIVYRRDAKSSTVSRDSLRPTNNRSKQVKSTKSSQVNLK